MKNFEQSRTMRIYTALGVTMFKGIVSEKIQIDVSQWPKGLYPVVLDENNRNQPAQFVKQ